MYTATDLHARCLKKLKVAHVLCCAGWACRHDVFTTSFWAITPDFNLKSRKSTPQKQKINTTNKDVFTFRKVGENPTKVRSQKVQSVKGS